VTDLDGVADEHLISSIDTSRTDDVPDSPHDSAAPLPAAATGRKRPDRGLLIASFVIASGMALIIWGFFTAITGDEGVERPAQIESISPVENAVQVLQQEGVSVDLQFGYEAALIIDGIELETTNIGELEAEPGQLLALPSTAIFDPGNSIISFSPAEDAAITEWSEGRHQARVVYWKIEEGRDNARSYNWAFEVV
jgi:hypothetical protein